MTAQRLIELRGIATVLITVDPEQSRQANPPRALHPAPYLPGRSLGEPDAELQRRILFDALGLLVSPGPPGTVDRRDYSPAR